MKHVAKKSTLSKRRHQCDDYDDEIDNQFKTEIENDSVSTRKRRRNCEDNGEDYSIDDDDEIDNQFKTEIENDSVSTRKRRRNCEDNGEDYSIDDDDEIDNQFKTEIEMDSVIKKRFQRRKRLRSCHKITLLDNDSKLNNDMIAESQNEEEYDDYDDNYDNNQIDDSCDYHHTYVQNNSDEYLNEELTSQRESNSNDDSGSSQDNDSSSNYTDDEEKNLKSLQGQNYNSDDDYDNSNNDNDEMSEENESQLNLQSKNDKSGDYDDDNEYYNDTTKSENKVEEYLNTKYMKKYINYFLQDNDSTKLYVLNRLIDMLCWTHHSVNKFHLPLHDLKKWTFMVFTNHLEKIYEFIKQHMIAILDNSFQTVKLFLSQNLKIYYKWYSSIRRNCNRKYALTLEQKESYKELIQIIKDECNKKIKKTKLTNKTKKYYVESHKMPETDFITFNVDLLTNIYSQLKNIPLSSLNNTTYNKCIQLLCAAFYIGIQGRVQALTTLKFKDAKTLLDKTKYIESNKFKTASTLGLQPISLTSLGRKILRLYTKTFRPFAAADKFNNPNDPLIINYDGNAVKNIGQQVTSFYEKNANLRITTTGIRAMMETKSAEMLYDNKIDNRLAESASRVIGHSRRTAESCYLMQSTYQSIRGAKEFENALGLDNMDEHEEMIDNSKEINIMPIEYKNKVVGINHPKGNDKHSKRVAFSLQEIDHLKRLVVSHKINGKVPNDIASRICESIWSDDNLINDFHIRHILSSKRLRPALVKLGVVR